MKILYKVINSLAVLALIPVLLFLPMFRFIVVVGMNSDSQILSILGSMLDISQIISNATGIDIDNLPEYYTIRDAAGIFTGENAKIAATDIDTTLLPETMVSFLTAAGVLFALALLLGVLVLIVGLFTRKRGLAAIFAGLGGLSAFAAQSCFSHIASQLISGKISMTEILGSMKSLEEYASYMSYVNIDIRILELGSAYTMMLIIFVALVILNIGFIMVDRNAPNREIERKKQQKKARKAAQAG